MKKYFKLTSIIFAFVIVFTSSNAVVMASDEEFYDFTNEGVIITEVEKVLSTEEVIKLLVEKNNFSYLEAKKLISQTNDSISTFGVEYNYITKTKQYNYGKYGIEIGGVYKVYYNGSFRQIEECMSLWSAAIESGNYSWNQFHITDTTMRYPTTRAGASARGAIEVQISISDQSSIGAELLGLGFSVGSSTSTTITYRKVVNLYLSYDVN